MKQRITISFIGLGLIGGSIAKALKERTNYCYLKVFDQNTNTLEQAKKDEIADEIYFSLAPSFFSCDYLFLCTPVSVNSEILEKYHSCLSEECIITDVGSVKTPIHQLIRKLNLSHHFIGGHPMAGSERHGYPNSTAGLLENAYYIFTPEADVSEDAVSEFRHLIAATGAIPFLLSVEHHDRSTAAISHLPHLIASSLVNLIQESDDEKDTFKTLAAGGFKDITRIASSSPQVWQQISIENREYILPYLDSYIQSLNQIRNDLISDSSDNIYNFFHSAQVYRDSFLDTRSGPFIKQYVLTINIPDKKGALADVINLLSQNDINIKNLGILHNREDQEGALRMEFYVKEEFETATFLLQKKGYIFHL